MCFSNGLGPGFDLFTGYLNGFATFATDQMMMVCFADTLAVEHFAVTITDCINFIVISQNLKCTVNGC